MAKHKVFKDPKTGLSLRIPSPPPLVDELERALGNPNTNMDIIAGLVQQDAGITAGLFRTLATPIYGLRKPPETVARAVSLVGLQTIADLVGGLSIQAALYGESLFYPWFWERANEIARYAAAIAHRQRMVCNIFPEHAHLAALFVDCGVPILIQHLEQYEYPFITARGHVWPHVVAEDQRHNTDHAVVGYLAAKHWRLPGYVCEAIRWHHDPVNVNDKAATMVAILQTAIHLYNVNAMKEDHDWPGLRRKALAEIGVAEEGLREFEDDLNERLAAH
ncbi:MAG: HDOD domain-containing protein [Pseudomonadota bacterium]